MIELIKVKVTESNFHEDLLPGREIELNLAHVRFVVHDQDSTLLFFQNDDCLRVKPRLELTRYARTPTTRSADASPTL
ncbi:MAG TPA: hypothetical protein VFO10_26390 [Oligoflexus sp.]|jgi:hypothetical protein|uniref:hypothetical protein n=1 Tax=Oligoflexus sp. TaxID=1971216 RepID=UPI002D805B73|nr:hypothetical protein [Oligoflexus sp.]HET9240822.1 hypothetical protein [Oligoflexus sp.]